MTGLANDIVKCLYIPSLSWYSSAATLLPNEQRTIFRHVKVDDMMQEF